MPGSLIGFGCGEWNEGHMSDVQGLKSAFLNSVPNRLPAATEEFCRLRYGKHIRKSLLRR
jgi:hypothetical protein